MIFREITADDVPALFAVRVATRENSYTLAELDELGITVPSVTAMLTTSHRGWLCEVDGEVVGFAMGDRENGELWVIAVLPDYEGRGAGARLITLVEDWLWSRGWAEIWLTTDIDPALRAYGFYLKLGWVDSRIENGLRYMTKANPDPTESARS